MTYLSIIIFNVLQWLDKTSNTCCCVWNRALSVQIWATHCLITYSVQPLLGKMIVNIILIVYVCLAYSVCYSLFFSCVLCTGVGRTGTLQLIAAYREYTVERRQST